MKKKISLILLIILNILIFIYTLYFIFNTEEITKNTKFYKEIIIIGDSRMSLIKNKIDYSKEIPKNISFIAENGKEIKWFNKVAIKELTEKLSVNNENVAVVINMGVNDISFYNNIKGTVNAYKEGYTMPAKIFPNVHFYILSINPINENIINDYFKLNTRTNKKIEKTNNMFQEYINNSKKENLKYCDSYNNINFNTKDGLHYTKETNEKIIDYIINDCIK